MKNPVAPITCIVQFMSSPSLADAIAKLNSKQANNPPLVIRPDYTCTCTYYSYFSFSDSYYNQKETTNHVYAISVQATIIKTRSIMYSGYFNIVCVMSVLGKGLTSCLSTAILYVINIPDKAMIAERAGKY